MKLQAATVDRPNGHEEEQSTTEQKDSEPGQIIAGSNDLAAELFLHLPPSSLSNFKYASKQWLSLISDTHFISMHARLNPPSLSGVFLYHYYGRSSKLEFVSFKKNHPSSPEPFLTVLNSKGLRILQSCNGLMLCCSEKAHYICNPTKNQWKQIPLPNDAHVTSDCALNLAFDPSKSPYYTIVCVSRFYGRHSHYKIEIYSSKTRLWRPSGDPFLATDVLDFRSGVFCNGAIHWLNRTSGCLYFNLDQECLRTTPEAPPELQFPSNSHNLFRQSNRHLHFVVERPLPNFKLFEMAKDYSGWFLHSVIDFEALAIKFPIMARDTAKRPHIYPLYDCNVLSVVHGASADHVEVVVSMAGQIISFNPKTNASKKIGDMMRRPTWYKDFTSFEYFETLSLV
ncbi:hypothetical protein Ancab_015958 [Ancistrocladus abbreviatus]